MTAPLPLDGLLSATHTTCTSRIKQLQNRSPAAVSDVNCCVCTYLVLSPPPWLLSPAISSPWASGCESSLPSVATSVCTFCTIIFKVRVRACVSTMDRTGSRSFNSHNQSVAPDLSSVSRGSGSNPTAQWVESATGDILRTPEWQQLLDELFGKVQQHLSDTGIEVRTAWHCTPVFGNHARILTFDRMAVLLGPERSRAGVVHRPGASPSANVVLSRVFSSHLSKWTQAEESLSATPLYSAFTSSLGRIVDERLDGVARQRVVESGEARAKVGISTPHS